MHRPTRIEDLADLAVALLELEASLGRAAVREAGLDHSLLPNELLGNPIQGGTICDLLLVVVRGDLGGFFLFRGIEGWGLNLSCCAGSGGEEGDEEETHGGLSWLRSRLLGLCR